MGKAPRQLLAGLSLFSPYQQNNGVALAQKELRLPSMGAAFCPSSAHSVLQKLDFVGGCGVANRPALCYTIRKAQRL